MFITITVVGIVLVAVLAGAGHLGAQGRETEMLVAPRGARYGDATALVVAAGAAAEPRERRTAEPNPESPTRRPDRRHRAHLRSRLA